MHKAEKALMNECVRTMNNTIELHEHQSNMYRDQLARVLGPVLFQKCEVLTNVKRS